MNKLLKNKNIFLTFSPLAESITNSGNDVFKEVKMKNLYYSTETAEEHLDRGILLDNLIVTNLDLL